MSYYKEAIRQNPRDFLSYSGLGGAFEGLHQHEEAAKSNNG